MSEGVVQAVVDVQGVHLVAEVIELRLAQVRRREAHEHNAPPFLPDRKLF